jgi:hypothetical protein
MLSPSNAAWPLSSSYSTTPDVGALVDVTRAPDLLGRHEAGGAERGVLSGEGAPGGRGVLGHRGLGELGDAEVEHLDDLASVGRGREKQVGRLEIAVHDARAVRVRDGLEGLQREVDGPVDGEEADASEQALEVLALEQLHDDVGLATLERADVHDARDVLALEAGDGAGLAHEALDGLLVPEQVRGEHLHRHVEMEERVVGGNDRAHRTLTEDAFDAVLAVDQVVPRGCSSRRRG